MMLVEICVVVFDPTQLESAREFSVNHGYPLVVVSSQYDPKAFAATIKAQASWAQKASFFLVYTHDGVLLRPLDHRAGSAVSCEFTAGKNLHRLRFGGGKGQALAKAVGLADRPSLSILDATAGLGRDGFVLASLGAQVQLAERCPIVLELLKSGLQRGLISSNPVVVEAVRRMHLTEKDGIHLLSEMPEDAVDVIYLDPMFPERKKSALVKKEMQYFHSIVGGDSDSALLLDKALEKAGYRVVVKRPSHAGCLNERKPTYQMSGKSTRYDIYVKRSLKNGRRTDGAPRDTP